MAAGTICHVVFMATSLLALGTNIATEDADATCLVQLQVIAGGSHQESQAPATAAYPPEFFAHYDMEERVKLLQCIVGGPCDHGTKVQGFLPGKDTQKWPEFPCILPGVPCLKAKGTTQNPPLPPLPTTFTLGQPPAVPAPGMPPGAPGMESPAAVLGAALAAERAQNTGLLQQVITGGASLTSLKVGSDAAQTEVNLANTEYQQWYQEERRLDSVEAQELAVEHEYFMEEETCKSEKSKLQVEVSTEQQKLVKKKEILEAVKKEVSESGQFPQSEK